MKTSLEQIAAAVAPVEELPPGGPAGAIGGPGDAGGADLPPGAEGAAGGEDMPDEPPVDGDELGDVDDAGAEPFSKGGGGKGGSKGAEGSRKREGSKGAEGSRDREEAE